MKNASIGVVEDGEEKPGADHGEVAETVLGVVKTVIGGEVLGEVVVGEDYPPWQLVSVLILIIVLDLLN